MGFDLKKYVDDKVWEAKIYTHLAYLVADVANSFALESESRCRKFGVDFKYEDRRMWNRVQRLSQELRGATMALTHHFNKIDVDTQDYSGADESDFLMELLKVCADRIPASEEAREKLLDYIKKEYPDSCYGLTGTMVGERVEL